MLLPEVCGLTLNVSPRRDSRGQVGGGFHSFSSFVVWHSEFTVVCSSWFLVSFCNSQIIRKALKSSYWHSMKFYLHFLNLEKYFRIRSIHILKSICMKTTSQCFHYLYHILEPFTFLTPENIFNYIIFIKI